MPKLKHIIQHRLEVHDVIARLKSSLARAMADQSGEDFLLCDETWDADYAHYAFMVGSYSLSLTVHVRVGELDICGKIPLAALPFRRQIKRDLSALVNQILK